MAAVSTSVSSLARLELVSSEGDAARLLVVAVTGGDGDGSDMSGCLVGWLLVGCWLVVGWLLVGCWLVVGWLLVGCWLVVGWLLVGCWLVVGWLLVGCWLVVGWLVG